MGDTGEAYVLAGGGVVDEPCFNSRSLHDIAGLDAIVKIHVGVMGARGVLHGILHESETGQTDPQEAGVVSLRVRA